MERLVIAFSNDRTREMVKSALESAGIIVRAAFKTGADVLRQVKFMGGGIVICAHKLPDMTAAQLSDDLENSAFMLALGNQEQLLDMESENIFTLPTPFSRGELIAAVRMLKQMESKQLLYLLPQKKRGQAETILRAKELLMLHFDLSESEAHKKLQSLSMRRGIKAAAIAEEIIKEFEEKKR